MKTAGWTYAEPELASVSKKVKVILRQSFLFTRISYVSRIFHDVTHRVDNSIGGPSQVNAVIRVL